MPSLKFEGYDQDLLLQEDNDIMSSTEHGQQHSELDPRIRARMSTKADSRESAPVQLPSPEDSSTVQEAQTGTSSASQLPTPGEQTQGLDDDLLALGARSRKLIKTIQKLETLQIQSTLPSLPKFVVVGDQSAGKSSIIEALCDISLPRNEGTCTRCPFQITTTSSRNGGGWTCAITLQQYYSYDPTTNSSGTFEQWHECAHQVYEFATVQDKAQLAPLLLRAQQAVLNPGRHPSTYISSSPPDLSATQVPFSPNLVCLDISGPELPDISFYDLPGTINVFEDTQQQHLVDFVERLVKLYLQDEKALILLACAADQDIETSTTFKYIHQCQARHRCLGVLTKADLVHSQRLDRIHRILSDEMFSLQLGWYITKQLSQAELLQGIPHAQARAREKQFFSNAPWSSLPPAGASRLGIDNLQDAISARLTDHILNALPEILGRVQARLHKVDADLLLFGERDANPLLTVRDVVRNITDSIKDHIKGRVNRKHFYAEIGEERVKLRTALADHTPELVLCTPGHQRGEFTVNLIDDDDEETPITPTPRGTMAHTPASSQSGLRATPGRPAKRKATDTAPQRANNNKRSRSEVVEASQAASTKLRLTLDELEDIVKTYSDNSLMAQGTAEVNNILIKRSLSSWIEPLNSSLESLRRLILSMVDTIARQKMNQYQATGLYPATLTALREFATEIITGQFRTIHLLLERELFKPSTSQKIRELDQGNKQALNAKRRDRRVLESIDVEETRNGKSFSELERRKMKLDEKFISSLGPDHYASYIDAFSLPLAYYSVAAARFNDNVFQHIDFDLLKTIHDEVNDVLVARLNAADADACATLLMEDPAREREREALIAEKRRLNLAMAELNDLPNLVDV